MKAEYAQVSVVEKYQRSITSVIPALWQLKQKNHEFKPSLSNVSRLLSQNGRERTGLSTYIAHCYGSGLECSHSTCKALGSISKSRTSQALCWSVVLIGTQHRKTPSEKSDCTEMVPSVKGLP